ncbi:protease inhibitor I42 family protein [Nocardia bovistercoris]|uniref:Protease inhibitor I42 family protein n=1 Tax=Nocardia bovistercoris TaxID=2785916 RepID=A0A931IJV6_9NOCA|nr:protease inhibitor I42 family protein [Nocardia bovistercoris]
MRRIGTVVVLAVGIAGCGAPESGIHEADGVRSPARAFAADHVLALVVTEADDGSRRNLAIDQRLTVALPADPSTGYRWRLAHLDPTIVRPIGHPDSGEDSAVPEPPGSAGIETWTFTGNAVGSGPLVMEYARPWEHDVLPARTFTVTIEVN